MNDVNLQKRRLLGAIGAGIVALPLLQLVGCSKNPESEKGVTSETNDPALTDNKGVPVQENPGNVSSSSSAAAANVEGLPAGKKPVNPDEALPKALGYYEDTNAVDEAKFPKHKKNQDCLKCSFYTAVNDQWGNCSMITTGVVRAKAWCNSYQPKA